MFSSRIAALFEQIPMLCGFTVSADLEEVQIDLHTWPGWEPGNELSDEVRAALEQLIADDPLEAGQLLRGRTFARSIH